MFKKIYIIAEAGINHNGSENNAKELIKIAHDLGADAIKFQTYITENLVIKNANLADYQKKNSDIKNQYELLKKYELSKEIFIRLKKYAKKIGITFLSSPFDLDSAKFLIKKLRIETIKIASGEITNAPLLNYIGINCRKILLSTGMSSKKEIKWALDLLAYSIVKKRKPKGLNFIGSFKKFNKKNFFKNKILLMHCTSEYPAKIDNLNLLAIKKIKKDFKLEIGYSDHSTNNITSIISTSLGAKVVEKHLTLSKKLPGPDHSSSFNKREFKEMVESIRLVEKILGQNKKKASDIELKNLLVSRKSLIAKKRIKKGDKINIKNITSKRPGIGINPMYFWKILGKKATKNYHINDPIKESFNKKK